MMSNFVFKCEIRHSAPQEALTSNQQAWGQPRASEPRPDDPKSSIHLEPKPVILRSCKKYPGKSKSRPTPLHRYSFIRVLQSNGDVLNLPKPTHEGPRFTEDCVSDSGCERTCIALNTLQYHNVKFDPNHEGARLQAANHQPLPVEGVVILEVTFHGTNQTTLMNCLVSSDLNHKIFISWYDAMKVGQSWYTERTSQKNRTFAQSSRNLPKKKNSSENK